MGTINNEIIIVSLVACCTCLYKYNCKTVQVLVCRGLCVGLAFPFAYSQPCDCKISIADCSMIFSVMGFNFLSN